MSPNDLLRDFSGSRNVRVARGQKECLGQRPLSDTERNASTYSASKETFGDPFDVLALARFLASGYPSDQMASKHVPGLFAG
jgi:hypothetical protein